jgi:hypothetical protein
MVISKPDSNTTFFIGNYFNVKWIQVTLPRIANCQLPIDFDAVKVFKCATPKKFWTLLNR